jgi:hypothetical protein
VDDIVIAHHELILPAIDAPILVSIFGQSTDAQPTAIVIPLRSRDSSACRAGDHRPK